MYRIAVLITSALLVVAPAVSRAQEATDAPAEQPTHQLYPSPAPTPLPARRTSTGAGAAVGGEVRPEVVVKAVPTPPPGAVGIVSEASGVGGIFRDSDTEAEAWLGANSIGVWGYGVYSGGYFKDSGASGAAILGYGDYGVYAWGNNMGAYFENYIANPNHAYIAYNRPSGTDAGGIPNNGYYGVYAEGQHAGGYFEDADNPSYAYVAHEHRGIEAFGSGVGGYFSGTRGVEAYGGSAGGYFEDSSDTGYAYIAYGDRGVEAFGYEVGGAFSGVQGISADGSDVGGYFVGSNGQGIEAYGFLSGGYFEDTDNPSYAYVAHEHRGIEAFGSGVGGYFSGTYGVEAYGGSAGGHFESLPAGIYANVATSTNSFEGNGAKSFVQNHPYDAGAVIVYAAPEGDEVATYTRGTARLVDGEAVVPLGETFEWVTNPDIGLTTYLTPVGEWSDLYVAERTTERIVVRSAGGARDAVFDYIVYGLRIGFEDSSVVREKEVEAYIPAMTAHRELYARRPDLRRYSSLERFTAMHETVTGDAELDLGRARALRDAVGEFDPEVHAPPMARGRAPNSRPVRDEIQPGAPGAVRRPAAGSRSDAVVSRHGVAAAAAGAPPMDDGGNVYATSFRPSSEDLASLVDLSEPVEPGDVLVIDREHPGVMRRAFEASDSGVVGVVAAAPGLVLGTRAPTVDPEGGAGSAQPLQAPAAFAGVVRCKVDASYGAIWPGDLLVTSPTPGHAMRMDTPLPGTMLGKALEGLEEGVGTIEVLVMLR